MKKVDVLIKTSLGAIALLSCFIVSAIGAEINSQDASSSTHETSLESSTATEDIKDSSETDSSMESSSSDSSSLVASQEEEIIQYTEIEDLLSDDVKTIISPFAESGWDKLSTALESLDKFVKFDQDHVTISEDKKILVGLILITEALENDLFEDANTKNVASETQKQLLLQLESFEKAKYSDDIYESLTNVSQEFQEIGKKTELVLPRQVVLLGQSFTLKKAPIKYDGHVLISLDDVLQYVNASIQIDEERYVVALQTEKILLEFARGSNVAYVNDKTNNMGVPSLYFKDTVYISAEFFAKTYGVQYQSIKDTSTIVFYGNASL